MPDFAIITEGSGGSDGLIKALGKQVNAVNLLDTMNIGR